MQTIDIKQIKGIYTDRYYKRLSINHNKYTFDKEYKEIVIKCGNFTAKYNKKINYPLDSFGLGSWKQAKCDSTEVSFYDKDQLLFTKKSLNQPCLILHCLNELDQTYTNTFYCIREQYKINIYDMNNKFIREAVIGPDCILDFQRVNKQYAISITEEMCTYEPFTGLINLDMFFSQKENEEPIKPYDNSRTAVCLRSDSQIFNELRYFPLICTDTGFIVENIQTNEILPDIIPYEKVHQEEVYFDDDEIESQTMKLYAMLANAGFDINKIDKQINETGSVCISAENIPKSFLDQFL